ncbi:hypothetical protein LTR08_004442 [Meristemomyces frigidus]|nr:hypothetical protein LTR08_004442 [Meristemomyces frigidus]
MDPGTALGVVSLVYDVTKDLYSYYRTWKDCDRDVQELRVQLLWLHEAFKVVRDTMRKPSLSTSARELVYSAVRNSNDAANELRDILERVKSQASPQTALEKLKVQGRRACYPFRKSTVAAIAEQVECCRDALHLAVDLLSLDVTASMAQKLQTLDQKLTDGFDSIDNTLQQLHAIEYQSSSVKSDTTFLRIETGQIKDAAIDIKTATVTTRDNAALRSALDWLSPTDYSQQLNDLITRHQDGTGRWFLESSKFTAWSKGEKDTLFCPGYPGTGKTLMSAAVVHHLHKTVHTANIAVLYVFFNYKRHDEQTTEHILGALLRQVVYARAHVPRIVQELYDSHVKKNTRPSLDDLKKLMVSLAQDFERVHIVIDALDECCHQHLRPVLFAIREMQAQGKVKLLTTSRPLSEVQREVGTDFVLEVQASDADVALYLKSHMDELSRCVQSKTDLQEKVHDTHNYKLYMLENDQAVLELSHDLGHMELVILAFRKLQKENALLRSKLQNLEARKEDL